METGNNAYAKFWMVFLILANTSSNNNVNKRNNTKRTTISKYIRRHRARMGIEQMTFLAQVGC